MDLKTENRWSQAGGKAGVGDTQPSACPLPPTTALAAPKTGAPALPALTRGNAGKVTNLLKNGFAIDALDAMRGDPFDGPHLELGFDTEYVERDGERLVLTYQFVALVDDVLRQWVMFSLDGHRPTRDQLLAVPISGLSPRYEYADYQAWFVHLPMKTRLDECRLKVVHAPRVKWNRVKDNSRRGYHYEPDARARLNAFKAMVDALPYDEERAALLAPVRMTKREAKYLPVIGKATDPKTGEPVYFTHRGLLRAESVYDEDAIVSNDAQETTKYRYRDVFAGTRAEGCCVGWSNDYTDVGRSKRGRKRDPGWKLDVTLIQHYGMADLTTLDVGQFEKDLMVRTSKVQGGLVTIYPVPVMVGADTNRFAFQQIKLEVRDGMCYAPAGKKTLAALGKAIDVPKIEIPHWWKEHMDQLWTVDPALFLEYAVNDSVIVLLYAKALFGADRELPITANGIAAQVAKDYIAWYFAGLFGTQTGPHSISFDGLSDADRRAAVDYNMTYRGLIKIKDSMAYMATGMVPFARLTPCSTDAATVMNMASIGYHGGLNGCTYVGQFPELTYDVDSKNAYPTGMVLVVDVDWRDPILTEWRNRDLSWDDFDQALGPCTPLLCEVEFGFPKDVYQPAIAVTCDTSLVFPRTSKGVNSCVASGPELFAAMKLGAKIRVKHGIRLRILRGKNGEPSRCLSEVCRLFVESRADAVSKFGKKSLAELLAKLGINGNYGKVAQGVSPKATYNAMKECMEDLEGSSITSPYHACMITALVRTLLVCAMNQLHELGYEVHSVTTDGFITNAPIDVLEGLDLYGVAQYFRSARMFLTNGSDPTVWALKHAQDDLLNFSTRGNISLHVGGTDSVLDELPGVCAHNSLVTGKEKDTYEDRRAMMLAVASRTGRVETHKARPTSFRALTSRSERADFAFRDQGRYLSMDFDLKRKPLRDTLVERPVTIDGVTYQVATFDTEPWDSVADFLKGKKLGQRIAQEGDCLRTRADWERWFLRFAAEGTFQAKDPVWTYVRAAVCGYRQGTIEIPPLAALDTGEDGCVDKCCRWINRFVPRSSPHFGKFNRNTWKDARKSNRNLVVPEDMLADVVECMRNDDPDSWLVMWP